MMLILLAKALCGNSQENTLLFVTHRLSMTTPSFEMVQYLVADYFFEKLENLPPKGLSTKSRNMLKNKNKLDFETVVEQGLKEALYRMLKLIPGLSLSIIEMRELAEKTTCFQNILVTSMYVPTGALYYKNIHLTDEYFDELHKRYNRSEETKIHEILQVINQVYNPAIESIAEKRCFNEVRAKFEDIWTKQIVTKYTDKHYSTLDIQNAHIIPIKCEFDTFFDIKKLKSILEKISDTIQRKMLTSGYIVLDPLYFLHSLETLKHKSQRKKVRHINKQIMYGGLHIDLTEDLRPNNIDYKNWCVIVQAEYDASDVVSFYNCHVRKKTSILDKDVFHYNDDVKEYCEMLCDAIEQLLRASLTGPTYDAKVYNEKSSEENSQQWSDAETEIIARKKSRKKKSKKQKKSCYVNKPKKSYRASNKEQIENNEHTAGAYEDVNHSDKDNEGGGTCKSDMRAENVGYNVTEDCEISDRTLNILNDTENNEEGNANDTNDKNKIPTQIKTKRLNKRKRREMRSRNKACVKIDKKAPDELSAMLYTAQADTLTKPQENQAGKSAKEPDCETSNCLSVDKCKFAQYSQSSKQTVRTTNSKYLKTKIGIPKTRNGPAEDLQLLTNACGTNHEEQKDMTPAKRQPKGVIPKNNASSEPAEPQVPAEIVAKSPKEKDQIEIGIDQSIINYGNDNSLHNLQSEATKTKDYQEAIINKNKDLEDSHTVPLCCYECSLQDILGSYYKDVGIELMETVEQYLKSVSKN